MIAKSQQRRIELVTRPEVNKVEPEEKEATPSIKATDAHNEAAEAVPMTTRSGQ